MGCGARPPCGAKTAKPEPESCHPPAFHWCCRTLTKPEPHRCSHPPQPCLYLVPPRLDNPALIPLAPLPLQSPSLPPPSLPLPSPCPPRSIEDKDPFVQWSWSFYHANCQMLSIATGAIRPERALEVWRCAILGHEGCHIRA